MGGIPPTIHSKWYASLSISKAEENGLLNS